jgi:hypothetical protein
VKEAELALQLGRMGWLGRVHVARVDHVASPKTN